MPAVDIAIVGGGPVGSALALALSHREMSLAMLDARAATVNDQRAIALSLGSRILLERLGVWQRLRSTPIDSIHVSQRGGFGRTVLSASERGVPALGYVCAYAGLHGALAEAVARTGRVQVQRPAVVEAIADGPHGKRLMVRGDGHTDHLDAKLVVIADGGSLTGTLARQVTRDYRQSAVVASVACDRPHGCRAYERFTAQGPIALLPFDERYALVWTVAPEQGERLRDIAADDFLARLQEAFGGRAGRFVRVDDRAVFPLALRFAATMRQDDVILLGNAAQTLHPVAGQGFNLGLRDAFALAVRLERGASASDIRAAARGFAAGRAVDRVGTALITDLLVNTFSNDLAPMRALRGCALTLLDLLPPARRAFADRMMFGA